jgi:hypothetical protein
VVGAISAGKAGGVPCAQPACRCKAAAVAAAVRTKARREMRDNAGLLIRHLTELANIYQDNSWKSMEIIAAGATLIAHPPFGEEFCT